MHSAPPLGEIRFNMIITAKWLVPVTSEPIEDGAVFIDEGKIVDFGPSKAILKNYPGQKIREFKGGILLPGFVNAHTHLELSLFEGKIRLGNFENWLFELVTKIRTISEDQWRASCEKGVKQLIQSGTTTVGDIAATGFSIDALLNSGLRAKVYKEAISPSDDHLKDFFVIVDYLRKKISNSLVEIGISPHSPYTVSQKALEKLNAFARDAGLDFCMHVAESKAEEQYLKSGSGPIVDLFKSKFKLPLEIKPPSSSPVAYLKNVGARHAVPLLNNRFTAIHAVQVSETDLTILKDAGSRVVLCPVSNQNLAVGLPPVDLYQEAAFGFALGTDSLASNSSLDIVKEAAFTSDNFDIGAKDLLKALTINGAKALGLGEKTGSIEAGKEADVIVITGGDVSRAPTEHIISGNWRLLASFVAGKMNSNV